MQKLLFFISVILLNFSSFSQNTFSLQYGDEDYFHNFRSSAETSEAYYIAQSTYSQEILGYKPYGKILKLNKKGELIKELKINAQDSSILLGHINISNDKIFVFSTERTNSFTFYILDKDLNIISKKEYIFSDFPDRIVGYIKTDFNYDRTNFYLSSVIADTELNEHDGFIMKFTPEGDSITTKVFEENGYENIYSISSFISKDSLVFSKVYGGIESHYLYIINNNIEIVDSSLISIEGAYGIDMAEGEVEVLNDDTIVYACDYQDDIYKTRLSLWDTDFNKLNEVFIERQDTSFYIAYYNLEIAKDGNILLGQNMAPGPVPSPGPFPSWFALNKFDKDLNLIWQKYYGGDANYGLKGTVATNDGGCIMYGSQWIYENANIVNAFLLKVDEFGNGPSNSINEPLIKARELILCPNPGSTQLNIRTAVQRIGGEFAMYDISGKLVFQKHIKESITTINTEHLPSGAYIYNYTHENEVIESGKWVKE